MCGETWCPVRGQCLCTELRTAGPITRPRMEWVSRPVSDVMCVNSSYSHSEPLPGLNKLSQPAKEKIFVIGGDNLWTSIPILDEGNLKYPEKILEKWHCKKGSGSSSFQGLVKHGLHVCMRWRWPHNGRCSRHAAAVRPRPRQSSGGPRSEVQRPPPQPSGGNSQGYAGPQDHIPHDHDPITKISTDFIERLHGRQFASMITVYIYLAV